MPPKPVSGRYSKLMRPIFTPNLHSGAVAPPQLMRCRMSTHDHRLHTIGTSKSCDQETYQEDLVAIEKAAAIREGTNCPKRCHPQETIFYNVAAKTSVLAARKAK